MPMTDDELAAALATYERTGPPACTDCTAQALCPRHRKEVPTVEQVNERLAEQRAQRLAQQEAAGPCALCGGDHATGRLLVGGWGSCLPPDLVDSVTSGQITPEQAAVLRDADQTHEAAQADETLANEMPDAIAAAMDALNGSGSTPPTDPILGMSGKELHGEFIKRIDALDRPPTVDRPSDYAMAQARMRQRHRECTACRALRVLDADATCPAHTLAGPR